MLNNEDGFIGSLGPSVILKYEEFPLGLDVGISPTFLSRDRFEGKQFGFPLEFTSHIRLEWAIHPHWELSYQVQHMSNLDLGHPNPGLNLHLFGIGYRF